MEAAIEAGADDVESDEEGHWIYTSFEAMIEVAAALEKVLGEAGIGQGHLEAAEQCADRCRKGRDADEADRHPRRRR